MRYLGVDKLCTSVWYYLNSMTIDNVGKC